MRHRTNVKLFTAAVSVVLATVTSSASTSAAPSASYYRNLAKEFLVANHFPATTPITITPARVAPTWVYVVANPVTVQGGFGWMHQRANGTWPLTAVVLGADLNGCGALREVKVVVSGQHDIRVTDSYVVPAPVMNEFGHYCPSGLLHAAAGTDIPDLTTFQHFGVAGHWQR